MNFIAASPQKCESTGKRFLCFFRCQRCVPEADFTFRFYRYERRWCLWKLPFLYFSYSLAHWTNISTTASVAHPSNSHRKAQGLAANNKYQEIKTLQKAIKELFDSHPNITQATLVRDGYFQRTRLNRLVRNSNDKGGDFPVTMKDIITLAIAFKLNAEETQELINVAFPEFQFYQKIIKEKMSLADANELLYEQGSDLLGTSILDDWKNDQVSSRRFPREAGNALTSGIMVSG